MNLLRQAPSPLRSTTTSLVLAGGVIAALLSTGPITRAAPPETRTPAAVGSSAADTSAADTTAEDTTAEDTAAVGPTPSNTGSLPLGDVRWQEDFFWGQRLQANRLGTLPTLTRIMQGSEHSQFLQNFRIAAGLAEGRHRGPSEMSVWIRALP